MHYYLHTTILQDNRVSTMSRLRIPRRFISSIAILVRDNIELVVLGPESADGVSMDAVLQRLPGRLVRDVHLGSLDRVIRIPEVGRRLAQLRKQSDAG